MKTILVADDEDFLRLLVRETLDAHRVIEARDGPGALRLAQEAHPDLILLDWMMPGLDGPQVIEALREGRDTRDIPVVMVTGRLSNGERGQALERGAAACIAKPFRPRELRDCVEGLLRRGPAASGRDG